MSKYIIFFFTALLLIPVAAATGGQIVKVEFPSAIVHDSGSLTPWVYIKNIGNEAASYSVQISIEYANEWHQEMIWPTDSIRAGETNLVWPWQIQVLPSMPTGDYNVRVTLLSGDRATVLDEKTTDHAFTVERND